MKMSVAFRENGATLSVWFGEMTVITEGDGSNGGDIDELVDKSITSVISNAKSIGDYAFYNCAALTDASFPQAETVGAYAFNKCVALTTLDLPVAKTIGNYCVNTTGASLAKVTAPLLESIGTYAFRNCKKMGTLVAPNLTSVGESALKYTAITECHYPLLTTIPGSMCSGCSLLQSVELPNATRIGGYAFMTCVSLRSIILPSATVFETQAFSSCTSLIAVILPRDAVVTLINTGVFFNTPIASGTGYIYVPSALLTDYQQATNWSTYAAQIRALEDYTVDGTVTGALDESKI